MDVLSLPVVTEAMVSIAQQIQALQSMVATAKKRKGSSSDTETPVKKKRASKKKKVKISPATVGGDDDDDEDWVAEASPKRRKFTQKQSLSKCDLLIFLDSAHPTFCVSVVQKACKISCSCHKVSV